MAVVDKGGIDYYRTKKQQIGCLLVIFYSKKENWLIYLQFIKCYNTINQGGWSLC